MKYILTIFLVTVFASSGNTQEICNNGKDDDNNGLVDLKDLGCSCKDSLPVLNYLENPSFEDYVTCPSDPSFGLGLLSFPYWFSAPERGSVRYYNLDCPYKYSDTFPPAYPLPGGKGYIQISDYGNIGFGNKYYAAGCLKNTLYANQKYSFECFIGFSPNDMRGDYFKSPLKLTLFGHADCTASQFTNYCCRGCPLFSDPGKPPSNFVQLASVNVFGKGNWVKVRIDFIPPVDVNLLLVGPDCHIWGEGYRAIYYADNFSLSAEENFAFKTITVNNDCSGGIQLTAPPAVNAAYQWYKDSIAIIGATGSMYTVPRTSSAGNYNVRLLFANNCIVSSPANINPDVFNALTLGKDTTLCVGEKLELQANVPDVQYLWQDGSKSPTYTVNKVGNYSLTVTDNYGCSSSTGIKVNFKQCTNCPIEMPNAFTPNGDGRNDVFKVLTTCSLIDNFYLGIYNRWGQKIFETKEVTAGWDGMLKGQPLPLGTYVYNLQYKKYGTYTIVQKRGKITLLR